MALLTRRTAILTKIESTYGTDPTPAGTDALLVRNLTVTPIEADVVSRDIIRPYLGNYEQLLAQTRVTMSFEVEMAGSGAGATAPKFDSLLRACGMAATTTAAAVTGTATAGAAGSITLAVGTSATDNIYNGMVISITSGTGSGSKGIITAYNGTSKVATVQKSTAAFTPDATSAYSIAANVGYKPVSTAFESATVYVYVGGDVLHPVTGVRGTFSLSTTVNEIPTISFELTGIYNAPTTTSSPAVTYTNQAVPQIFKADNTSAFSLLDYSGCLQAMSLNIGNETIYRELIGCTKEVLITNRAAAGEATVEAPLLSAKDYFAAASTETTGKITMLHGTTAGNQVSLLAPKVDITNPAYSDQDGIQMLTVPFVAIPSDAGNDEVVLTFS